jgi:hypothetical protein
VTSILHSYIPHAWNETSQLYWDGIVQSYAAAARHAFVVPFAAFILAYANLSFRKPTSTNPPEDCEMNGSGGQNDFGRQRRESRVYASGDCEMDSAGEHNDLEQQRGESRIYTSDENRH